MWGDLDKEIVFAPLCKPERRMHTHLYGWESVPIPRYCHTDRWSLIFSHYLVWAVIGNNRLHNRLTLLGCTLDHWSADLYVSPTCLSVRAYKNWWSGLKSRSLRMGFPSLTITFSYNKAGWEMEFTRIWKKRGEYKTIMRLERGLTMLGFIGLSDWFTPNKLLSVCLFFYLNSDKWRRQLLDCFFYWITSHFNIFLLTLFTTLEIKNISIQPIQSLFDARLHNRQLCHPLAGDQTINCTIFFILLK